jgi:hypothetical protein
MLLVVDWRRARTNGAVEKPPGIRLYVRLDNDFDGFPSLGDQLKAQTCLCQAQPIPEHRTSAANRRSAEATCYAALYLNQGK